MPKPSAALSSADLTALAAPHAMRAWLAVVPDTVAATLSVTSTPSDPFQSLSVSGSLSAVRVGQTVKVTNSAGTVLRGYYRVRKAPTGSTLFLNESSQADPGLLPTPIRTAGIGVGDSVTVLDRYDLSSVFPRIDLPTSTIFEDYDQAYVAQNSTPPPIVNITATATAQGNITTAGHWAGFYDPNLSYATLTFTAQPLAWVGSSTFTYLWTIPSAWTIVSGSATTATFTARVSVVSGNGFYPLRLQVTDNYGNVVSAVRFVFVSDRSTYTYTSISALSETWSLNAKRVAVRLDATALRDIPHGALTLLVTELQIGDSVYAVPSIPRLSVGWLERNSLSIDAVRFGADAEIISPFDVLERVPSASQLWETTAAPTTWQQITLQLGHIDYPIWWLLRYRAANALRLFNYTPLADSLLSPTYRMTAFRVESGTVSGQLSALAARVAGGRISVRDDGEFQFVRDPSLLSSTARTTVPVRLTLSSAFYSQLSYVRRYRAEVKNVLGAAFAWDGIASQPTPYRAESPNRFGSGSATISDEQLITTGQTELNEVVGKRLAQANNPYGDIALQLAGLYGVTCLPTDAQFVNVQVSATQNAESNSAFTLRCIPTNLTRNLLENGAVQTALSVIAETDGVAGVARPVPVAGGAAIIPLTEISPLQLPVLPIDFGNPFAYTPTELMPIAPRPLAPQQRGRLFLATSEGYVVRVTFNNAGDPVFEDISPPPALREALGNAAIKLVTARFEPRRAFLFGSVGVLMCADILSSSVTWSVIPLLSEETPKTETITLDAGSALYTGYFDNGDVGGLFGGGNPGNCWGVEKTTTSTITPIAGVFVVFATPRTVTAVGMDFKRNNSDATGIARQAVLADPLGNVLSVPFAGPTVPANNVWQSVASGAISVANVKQITFQVDIIATTGKTIRLYLDNATYTYLQPAGSPYDNLSDFKSLGKRGAYGWLGRRIITGQDTVLYFRTFDNFKTIAASIVARRVANLTYTVAPNPHNPNVVVVSAGDPGAGDARLYLSENGGGLFTPIAPALTARGGSVWWNWSTTTRNQPNTTLTNLRFLRGLDGSDNLILERGTAGSPVTLLAAAATLYPETGSAYFHLESDLKVAYYVSRTGVLRRSINSGDTWSTSAASVPGGSGLVVRGISQFPADANFVLAFGYRALAFTTNAGDAWTSLWTAYDTWRSGTFGSEGETLVTAIPDLSVRFPNGV